MSDEKWASYNDLSEIDDNLMNRAVEAAMYYCYDAVNLVFELGSSTSGMYAHWHIGVSPSCTAYLDRRAPHGCGGHINEALQEFIKSCEQNDIASKKPKDPLDALRLKLEHLKEQAQSVTEQHQFFSEMLEKEIAKHGKKT